MKFQDSSFNGLKVTVGTKSVTHARTHARSKSNMPHQLFQSWGHKNPSKIFFSETGGPISTKLGMYNRGLQPIIICSNDDPRVTMTYFTARSNLVT